MMFFNADPRAETYTPPRLSKKQMLAVTQTICGAHRVQDWVKKLSMWLLWQSDNLSKPVAVTFSATDVDSPEKGRALVLQLAEGFDFIMRKGVDEQIPSCSWADLGGCISAMDTKANLSGHQGYFIFPPADSADRMDGKMFHTPDGFSSLRTYRYTLWFSHVMFDNNANLLDFPGWEKVRSTRSQ